MKEETPLNPTILKWARETQGLRVEDVAQKMNKDVDSILAWESGQDAPTYVQLEKLAYQVYKRPVALFFFPEPPEEKTPKQSFRTLPEQEIKVMSPRMRYLLRQAQAMQINLAELHDQKNPAIRKIIHDFHFKPTVSDSEMVAKVRHYLGVDLNTQFSWGNEDEAFKNWRACLESHGIFIFKEAFRKEADPFSGFCLYNEEFPVIYVNNSKPDTRQIFTLFHELAHLLLGTGGVDTRIQDYLRYLKGDNRKAEILCNSFAGKFLVPDSDFDQRIVGIKINDESINKLAKKYKISREVILRKFLDRALVDQTYYSEKVEEWAKQAKQAQEGKRLSKEGGGNYYFNKRVYLGDNYLQLAFSRYFQKKITVVQLADYLDIKVKGIPNMESLLIS